MAGQPSPPDFTQAVTVLSGILTAVSEGICWLRGACFVLFDYPVCVCVPAPTDEKSALPLRGTRRYLKVHEENAGTSDDLVRKKVYIIIKDVSGSLCSVLV